MQHVFLPDKYTHVKSIVWGCSIQRQKHLLQWSGGGGGVKSRTSTLFQFSHDCVITATEKKNILLKTVPDLHHLRCQAADRRRYLQWTTANSLTQTESLPLQYIKVRVNNMIIQNKGLGVDTATLVRIPQAMPPLPVDVQRAEGYLNYRPLMHHSVHVLCR